MTAANPFAIEYQSHRRLAVAAALVVLTLGLLSVTVFMWPSLEAQLATVLGVMLIAPFLVSWARGRLDLGEIVYPITLSYLVYFVFRTFYLLPAGFMAEDRPDFSAYVGTSLLLTLLGITCFLVGYYAPIGRTIARRIGERLTKPDDRRLEAAVYLCFIAGFLCRSYIYFRGSYTVFLAAQRDPVGAVELTIDYFGILSYYAFFLGIAHAYSPRSSRLFRVFVWLAVVPLTIVMALLAGSKMQVIWLLGGWTLARHYLRRPVSLSWLVGSAAVCLFVVFPIVTAYRTAASTEMDRPLHDMGRPAYAAFQDLLDERFFAQTVDMVSGRAPGVDTLALVVNYTPDAMPYQWGRTMILAPVMAFVPTIVWPAKADFIRSVVTGEEFGMLYFGRTDDKTAIAVTQLGELYLNFGWIGVPIGMVVFGLVCKTAYRVFRAAGPHPTSLLLYMYLCFHLTFIEGWFASTYSNLLKHLVTTLALAFALKGHTTLLGSPGRQRSIGGLAHAHRV